MKANAGTLGVLGLVAAGLVAALVQCSGGEPTPPPAKPAPAPAVAEKAPDVAFALPTREGRTPRPITEKNAKLAGQLEEVRRTLLKVVQDHGRDPQNPWAVAHAMLALGPDIELTNGENAVDHLFTTYAEEVQVGGESLLRFPMSRGRIRIEPHSDLLLKALTEGGVLPDRKVTVNGHEHTVGDLYRHSLWRTWVTGVATGFQNNSFNDAPWALQGLATWAPPELAWQAKGGRDMAMAEVTHQLVSVLDRETQLMQRAKETGATLQKDTRRGLFRYTCGGQHMIQGVAYSAARGFTGEGDVAALCAQKDLLDWRIDVELAAVDPHIASNGRPVQIVLLVQRMKFLGHTLETVHKIGALGLCELTDANVAASTRVANELVATVDALGKLGVFDDVAALRRDRTLDQIRGAEQVYLDVIGDAAHAVRGIDMATGKGTIRY